MKKIISIAMLLAFTAYLSLTGMAAPARNVPKQQPDNRTSEQKRAAVEKQLAESKAQRDQDIKQSKAQKQGNPSAKNR